MAGIRSLLLCIRRLLASDDYGGAASSAVIVILVCWMLDIRPSKSDEASSKATNTPAAIFRCLVSLSTSCTRLSRVSRYPRFYGQTADASLCFPFLQLLNSIFFGAYLLLRHRVENPLVNHPEGAFRIPPPTEGLPKQIRVDPEKLFQTKKFFICAGLRSPIC
ncbi:hypothetical protein BDN71DRAFT_756945 [Pleurotus eryngii]|uniref:Uncharacterized protein n=1 Tax=Pleurotus eryngii TaxID=5323 RepID=A0A9P6DGC0_PLEER|nr:hypothetical protein BDN71DRAFT_756945 [Pleurotus eryngii]